VVGAVGFVSVLFPTLLPLGLIKVDRETGKEIRDPNGLCIRCGPGEPGEFVGLIQRNHPVRDFDGYAADSNATRSKIMRDVWKKGDTCFRSGDILVSDEFGWLYFRDRAGDTFR
jgi:solute carrier family 27 fatty acid transporter 1/4